MFLLALAAAVSQTPRTAAAVTRVTASVRILGSASASEEWKSGETRHKREVTIKEADGRTTRLRLIEYE